MPHQSNAPQAVSAWSRNAARKEVVRLQIMLDEKCMTEKNREDMTARTFFPSVTRFLSSPRWRSVHSDVASKWRSVNPLPANISEPRRGSTMHQQKVCNRLDIENQKNGRNVFLGMHHTRNFYRPNHSVVYKTCSKEVASCLPQVCARKHAVHHELLNVHG